MAAQKGIGKLRQFGIAKEAVRGTAETAAQYWIPWSDFEINEKDKRVVDEQSHGLIEDAVGESIVGQWAEGKVSAPIGDKHFPLFLYALLGTLATTDNADSDAAVKDHTVTVAQSAQHQALSLFVDDPLAAADYKHALGTITGLELKFEKDKYLEYSINFKSKKGATATLTPAVTSAENRFLPQHLVFKLASAYSGLTAASAVSVKSLSLKINPNVEEDFVLGSLTPADFLNKQLEIGGDVELLWNAETYKTIALAGTSQAMRIDLINADVTIGTAAHPEIQINLAKVLFEEIAVSGGLNDFVKQTLKFKAFYSLSDSLMVNSVCTNVVASY
jgi:hypothetical protein